ncbi:MAG: 50S ribosomal protein L18 [Puniceicoccales bacterium]|jgi:large subunit ribosomal protein L18|nr:50S ribosomal protein L18 [Puniceicoccales bacterium]
MDPIRKSTLAQKRRWRVRVRVRGTMDRPRLSVCFSNRHVYAQCVDDERGVTLMSASSIATEGHRTELHANIAGAQRIGAAIAEKALAANVTHVVFDRGARRYHGCVKALADAARAGGLEF